MCGGGCLIFVGRDCLDMFRNIRPSFSGCYHNGIHIPAFVDVDDFGVRVVIFKICVGYPHENMGGFGYPDPKLWTPTA